MAEAKEFKVGETVYHQKFGEGTVFEVVAANRIRVDFGDMIRPMMADYMSRTAYPAEDMGKPIPVPPSAKVLPMERPSRHGRRPRPVRLETISASSFAGKERPVRQFLDSGGLFPMRNVTLLSGDGGTGKSLIAMQLACAVVAIGQWLGLKIQSGSVLYYSAEDDEEENHIRLGAIADADGYDLKQFDDIHIAVMAGEDAVLATENGKDGILKWTDLFDRLRITLQDIRPRLLVIDNLADVFAGNENARPSARQFIGQLRGLAMEFDMAVLLLSHPSLSGMSSGSGTSGNTAWSNSVRSRLYLHPDYGEDGKTEANPNRKILDTMKANYGPKGGSIEMEWRDGRYVTTTETAPPDALAGATKMMRAERVFLALLRRFNDQGRHVSPSRSPTFAPTMFAKQPMAEGVKAREFERVMEALLDRGEVRVDQVGPPSKRRQILVINSSPGMAGDDE